MKTYYLLLIFLGIIVATSCSDEDDAGTMDPAVTNFKMSISASSTSIMEDGGTANLTVTLDKVNQGDVIPFVLEVAGQATQNEDYEITGANTIANGSQSTTLTINTINDSDVEDDETIVVTLRENLENINIENGTVNLIISDEDMVQSACVGTSDTYLIDLEASNCTVDIESVLGINSLYEEQVSGGSRVINTNAIPNHNVGQFPNMGNPHSITAINSSYSISVSPTANSSVTLLTNNNGSPLYRFGVLYNGILLAPIAAEFFTNTQTGNDNTDWNENALSSAINLGTDCNNSHVFPSGMYHHHATPSAFIASMNIDGSSPVQIGWAADGYPIYYKYGNKNGAVVELVSGYQLKTEDRGGDGVSAPSGCPDGTYTQDYEYLASLGDLDECNGYQDPQLGYIYVITDTYPSIPRCFMATPSDDFRNN
ncbi:YHYH protein [Fulvivirgaceae bacterium BMA12]|uniref:YHYH protein n=1 Tax=Agaribacillus aureus TaxID=3051825 RepID=A0ABT8LBI9_9BACT|nr:YHYH protein [Fulvivirgaceae bacterium BMA12]